VCLTSCVGFTFVPLRAPAFFLFFVSLSTSFFLFFSSLSGKDGWAARVAILDCFILGARWVLPPFIFPLAEVRLICVIRYCLGDDLPLADLRRAPYIVVLPISLFSRVVAFG